MKTPEKVEFMQQSTTGGVPGVNAATPPALPSDPDPFDPNNVGPSSGKQSQKKPKVDPPSSQPQQNAKSGQPQAKDPYELLAQYGVTKSMIEGWKRQWGEVALSVLGARGSELYIVRPIFADEYVQVQQAIDNEHQAAVSQGRQFTTQDRIRTYRKILKSRCQLWSNVPQGAREKAGTLYSIGMQIEAISNFMDETEAAMSIVML